MNFSPILRFSDLGDLALSVRQRLTAVLEGWNIEHKPDGTHGAITADSLAVSGAVSGADLTVETLTVSDTGASAIDVAGGINAGSGHVGIVDTTGKIPAISSTYFASLSGANLTSIPETAITDGTLLARLAANETVAGTYTFTPGIKERGRTVFAGEWTTPAFDAGNFTGNGSMTWTVAAGDVLAYQYTLIGKTMYVNFYIVSSSVGGTPSTLLNIAVPGGFSSAKVVRTSALYATDNGTVVTAFIDLAASGVIIRLGKTDGTAWTASTDNTSVRGQLFFEVS